MVYGLARGSPCKNTAGRAFGTSIPIGKPTSLQSLTHPIYFLSTHTYIFIYPSFFLSFYISLPLSSSSIFASLLFFSSVLISCPTIVPLLFSALSSGKLKRFAKQFTPYYWTPFDWHALRDLRSWLCTLLVLFMVRGGACAID